MRHRFRIAEIAHENTSSSANGKIGACLADPFANGEGRIELIRSPSPKGAGGGCIDLAAILAQSRAQCQASDRPQYPFPACWWCAAGLGSPTEGCRRQIVSRRSVALLKPAAPVRIIALPRP